MFRKCTGCGKVWRSRDDFLGDPMVELVGYQVHFEDLETGLFLFNHLLPTCGTTLSLPVGDFTDLHDGPVFTGKLRDSEACPGHCLRRDGLDACSAHCECAYVSEILQIIRRWKKTAA